MPSASDVLQDLAGHNTDWSSEVSADDRAMSQLRMSGCKLWPDWSWNAPPGYIATPEDAIALAYLTDEWDFAGFAQPLEVPYLLYLSSGTTWSFRLFF